MTTLSWIRTLAIRINRRSRRLLEPGPRSPGSSTVLAAKHLWKAFLVTFAKQSFQKRLLATEADLKHEPLVDGDVQIVLVAKVSIVQVSFGHRMNGLKLVEAS